MKKTMFNDEDDNDDGVKDGDEDENDSLDRVKKKEEVDDDEEEMTKVALSRIKSAIVAKAV